MKNKISVDKVAVCIMNGRPIEYMYQVDVGLLSKGYFGEDGLDAAALAQDLRDLAMEYEKKKADTDSICILRALADSVEENNEIPFFITIKV